MVTGELKSKIDRLWDAFWTGGMSNPLTIIEQITYLLFIRRLDDVQTLRDKQAKYGKVVGSPLFGPDQQHLRWHQLRNLDAQSLHRTLDQEVFPFLRNLGNESSTYSDHMANARLEINAEKAGILTRVVDLVNSIPMDNRDTNGDIYEYMLSKLSTAGQNGQFRTPRHIIQTMVAMMDPKPGDRVIDPACGTAGFLVAASEHVREHHGEELMRQEAQRQFHEDMFHGYDFDSTMLRIGSMNMMMHGVESPDIRYRDALSEGAIGETDEFSLVLANPPFAGSLDYESVSKDLLGVVKTKKTELLFLALFLRLLQPGGRAAVIVPDGVLFGSSKAHKDLRKVLVENQRLDAVVKLPSGVFKPYAGVSTAILFFTKTNAQTGGAGATDEVWFYDVQADGFSLDDKRTPLLDEDKLGPVREGLSAEEHAKNNLPDVVRRWSQREAERDRARTEQSFMVPRSEIAENDYDLSINRYKEIVFEEEDPQDPLEIIAELEKLDDEIRQGLTDLKEMLK
ncbi:type I restriction-modification system subunit M [Nesterenkonia flava]|uniref:site-specific DNA-methyltransferase (adenine-specific) n=1 Tax=Nesterenkonia flava TaxID=469799 RepID=A0ABU1FW67_9MICC|nr:class I SAM-dependent DNA methyltransferase [Nesterenkonia flava]MDR5712725.1 class I SAM-dependent DNA methyltransferase [Nesterenkonia flava]